MKLYILLLSFPISFFSTGQEINDSLTQKWAVTAHVGMNTTSTNSSYASKIGYNWSVGISRNFIKKQRSFDHHLKLKAQAFTETLKDLPFYSLNSENQLVTSSYTSKGFYSMIYLGWGLEYSLPFKSKKIIIGGDIGFNYLLPARYKSIYSSGITKGVQTYRRPFNFLIFRPEISLKAGYKLELGKHDLILSPFYSYNFTYQYLNLVPTFHTFGFETTLKF